MRKVFCFMLTGLIAFALIGCPSIVIVEEELIDLEPYPCFTCSDAILGFTINNSNACNGSLEVWQEYKIQTCSEPSICKIYCAASLCNGKAPSHDCKECAMFGTIFHPYQQDQNYLTCKSDK